METRIVTVSDSIQALVVTNPSDRPIRIWQVSVQDCVNVRAGCGLTLDDVDIDPHTSVAVRTVERRSAWEVWHWTYNARSRWTPPTDLAFYQATVPRREFSSFAAPIVFESASFRPTGQSRTPLVFEGINVGRRLTLFFKARFLEPPIASGDSGTTGDSVTILVAGEQYKGDTAKGRISARRVDWRPVTRTDTANAMIIRQMGERILALMAAPMSAMADTAARRALLAGSPHPGGLNFAVRPAPNPIKDLGGGRWRACRAWGEMPPAALIIELIATPDCPAADSSAHARYNAYVMAKPNSLPVGARLETCALYFDGVAGGWARVEWYRNPRVCPADGAGVDSTQPNVLVLQRVR
jgi:hypothetical protein